MVYDVVRIFSINYILFDIIFLALFIFLLTKFKKKIPLIALFVGGILINFIVDWGIWLHTGIREISLPAGFLGLPIFWSTLVFFLWFSLSYGVEYTYVFIMFEKKSNKLAWTALVFGGWILIAFLSQIFITSNETITTIRHMSDFRIIEILILLLGFSLLFILKYDWKKIIYLFFIGFLITL